MSTPPRLVAFDVDLNRWTWAIEGGAAGQGKLGEPFPELPESIDTVLIEIAGPVMHRVGDEASECPYNKRRWMISNVCLATQIALYYGIPPMKVLVATSSTWTLGFDEPTRQAMAGIKPLKLNKAGARVYAENHDIRECRAMLYLYKGSQEKWLPLNTFLERL